MKRDSSLEQQVQDVLDDFLDSSSVGDQVLGAAVASHGDLYFERRLDDDGHVEQALSEAAKTEFEGPYRLSTYEGTGESELYVSSLRVHDELISIGPFVAHLVAGRAPHSSLPPLALRRLVQTMELALVELDGSSAIERYELVGLSSRARVMSATLEGIAACCRAEGALLWEYDYESESYHALHGFGPVGRHYQVSLYTETDPRGVARGVVAQARPGVPVVIYSLLEPESRTPGHLVEWIPHDPDVLERNGWDACVAWPVIADGHLLGAVSVYGPDLGSLNYSRVVRNAASTSVSEFLRDSELRRELKSSEQAFEAELSRNSSGRLAGELVHDYKSALDSIEDLLKNISRRSLSVGMQGMYDESRRSIDYLKKVTRSLGRLSRGQRSTGTADLADTVNASEPFLTALAEHVTPKIELRIRAPKELLKSETCSVDLDDLAALRIVSNLVENAALWSRSEDHPQVDVIVKAASPRPPRKGNHPRPSSEDDFVRLIVRDNGPGVAMEDRGRIFQRGWTNRRLDGGSGLGLYIVRKAVEAAGGTVAETGRRGEGAEFVVKFPPVGAAVVPPAEGVGEDLT